MVAAFIASALAGAATCLGALPLFVFRRIPHRVYDGLIGMSAGIMLSVTILSLINPALKSGSFLQVLIGLIVGASFIFGLERFLPHMEPHFSQRALSPTLRQGVLVAAAITIHNFPEGFASGVGYYSLPKGQGLALVLAIGVQNIPEGLAVALPLWKGGTGRLRSFAYTLASGLVEPLAGLIGILLIAAIKSLIPYALGCAGGAMLYVTLIHLIPESYGHKNEREATVGVVGGVVIMLFLSFIFPD